MAGELKVAFAAQGIVDVLILIEHWAGVELGAVFNARSISAQAQANKHIRKYAVIGCARLGGGDDQFVFSADPD